MPMIRAAQAVCLAALCWLLAECALTVRHARAAADELLLLADMHAAEIERRADERLAEAIALLDARLASIEARADRRLADATARADLRVGEALQRADARLAEALVEARALRMETQAAVAEARAALADVRAAGSRLDYWTDCEQNGLCWQGAVTDTLLAVRRAALAVDSGVPQMVAAAEASAAGVRSTAEASAETAQNLARLTQPGPRWLRYLGLGLGVAAPAAQVALPFALRRADLK